MNTVERQIYKGIAVRVIWGGDDIAELRFHRDGDAINMVGPLALKEIEAAIDLVSSHAGIRGLLISSGKEGFVAEADVAEFIPLFSKPVDKVIETIRGYSRAVSAIERLDLPTVAAINGPALGEGLEIALAADFRVAVAGTQCGLPAIRLGLIPGLGGTVRLPRITSAQVALDWITGGMAFDAERALAEGVVDRVCKPNDLRDEALALLRDALAGNLDWKQRRSRKRLASTRGDESSSKWEETREALKKRTAVGQPAPFKALELLERSMGLESPAAHELESQAFGELAKTQAATSLVHTFLSEQTVRRRARSIGQGARTVRQIGVLGAGIMGGGIAYTAALHGTPVILSDIAQRALDLGMTEVRKLLAKQVSGRRLEATRAEQVLGSIRPCLDEGDLPGVDLIIEAVVENLDVKRRVMVDLERKTGEHSILASNTSSLRIKDIAKDARRPQNIVGMHFFNPVPVMPLVEVVRGPQTSDATVAAAVKFVLSLRKQPIIVMDCPGFLVNRVLTAYMSAFLRLIEDGADFQAIDRAMERFGWPMGPAYLNDVVGMDTGAHVFQTISAGYPGRMTIPPMDAVRILSAEGRLGQKSGQGFYRYEPGPSGRPTRSIAAETYDVLARAQPNGRKDYSDAEIVERMMLPMLLEAARCHDEGIAESAAEIDVALLMGLGFPAYLGGALQYIDWLGTGVLLEQCDRHVHLGELYAVPQALRERHARGSRYYA